MASNRKIAAKKVAKKEKRDIKWIRNKKKLDTLYGVELKDYTKKKD